mmetsp:Transcript_67758/g.122124  ORF Transcript_67758/g.122124 Transcript_67758/m.122124 type:complete len:86 (-) Transcript_67758:250-507(-)
MQLHNLSSSSASSFDGTLPVVTAESSDASVVCSPTPQMLSANLRKELARAFSEDPVGWRPSSDRDRDRDLSPRAQLSWSWAAGSK